MTGLLTILSFLVFFSGLREESRCELCDLMLIPGVVFFIFLLSGLYTLFSSELNLNSKKRLLNTINFTAIILSIAAIVLNFHL